MITLQDKNFIIPGAWSVRAKSAPDRVYMAARKQWKVPNHSANRKHIAANFIQDEFEPAAWAAMQEAEAPAIDVPAPAWPAKVTNHLTGEEFDVLPHQTEALNRAWGKREFAFFHGMGSGKTLTCLLWWDAMFKAGLITEAWAIVPNSLIGNWEEEVQKWTPWNADKISVYGVLSLSAGSLPTKLVQASHAGLAVTVDESQRIKESTAKRTKVITEIGKHAGFRSIMTGTNITKGVEDLYSQYFFLEPNIIGHRSFFTFRNKYCLMGGFEGKKIIGYQNMNDLMDLLRPVTDVVEDPVDLPPMSHQQRIVALTGEQKELLGALKNEMYAEYEDGNVAAENALAYYTRGAQILGGFFPTTDGRTIALKTNPKLAELMDVMNGTDKKVVIFARFRAEQAIILAALEKAGIVANAIRSADPTLQDQVRQFQKDPAVRAIVATYAMGSVGFTLTAGKVLVKYSGTFNYEDEAQSEFRIKRIGQDEPTVAIRLMANHKLDRTMLAIAEGKESIASFVNNRLKDPRSLTGLLDCDNG